MNRKNVLTLLACSFFAACSPRQDVATETSVGPQVSQEITTTVAPNQSRYHIRGFDGAASVHPRRSELVAVGGKAGISIINIETARIEHSLCNATQYSSLFWNESGTLLAGCTWEGAVHVWRFPFTGETRLAECDAIDKHSGNSFQGDRAAGTKQAISQYLLCGLFLNDEYLLVCRSGEPAVCIVWNRDSGHKTTIRVPQGVPNSWANSVSIRNCAYSTLLNKVAIATSRGAYIASYEPAANSWNWHIVGQKEATERVAFDAPNGLLIVGKKYSGVLEFDVRSNTIRREHRMRDAEGRISDWAAVSADGRTFALAMNGHNSQQSQVIVLACDRKTPIHTLDAHTGPVEDLTFNADGSKLISASFRDQSVRVIAVPAGGP